MSIVIAADILGIIAFALSGFLTGIRHKLDLLGIFIAMALTALGGGIIRDTILGRTPFAFDEYYPSITILITLFLAILFKVYQREALERKWLFVISDTIGLVAFSITGALLAIDAGYNFFGVIILSFLTAIGGGVTRDILVNKVPDILIKDFYGSIALVVSVSLVILNAFNMMNDVAITATATFAIFLRLIAYKKKWHLPRLHE